LHPTLHFTREIVTAFCGSVFTKRTDPHPDLNTFLMDVFNKNFECYSMHKTIKQHGRIQCIYAICYDIQKVGLGSGSDTRLPHSDPTKKARSKQNLSATLINRNILVCL
jgi:hypothetical protein